MNKVKSRKIKFLDTTLRDGEQAPGNAMTPDQKLSLALKLEESGVDYIETGFPASSKFDFEATQIISKSLTKAKFATFSRAIVNDIKIAIEAGGTSERHTMLIAATGSDLHLKNKRNITRSQAIAEVVESVKYARENSDCRVAVGIEDASRGDYEYIGDMTKAIVAAGVHQIILCDTTGYSTPVEYGRLIAFTKEYAGENVSICTHCHNDLGLAVANTLAGLDAGADEVQVTLGGIGERAGNASFEEIAAIIEFKGDDHKISSNIDLSVLYQTYNALRKIIKLDEPRTKSVFGQYAFSTAAGIHQQGMLLDPNTYEFVKPDKFNRQREFFVARHSGRSIIRYLLDELNIESDDDLVKFLYDSVIEGSPESSCLSMTEVQVAIEKILPAEVA